MGLGEQPSEQTLPILVSGLDDAGRIVAGFNTSCAISVAGELYCWGDNSYATLADGLYYSADYLVVQGLDEPVPD